MRKILLLITLLSALSTSNGQGFATGGGEVVFTDGIDGEVDSGSTIISISDASPRIPFHLDYYQGSGGAAGGSGSENSGSSRGEFVSESLQVSYGGDHFIAAGNAFNITCILTVFDRLKWTRNGRALKFQHTGYTVAENPAPQGFIGSRLSVANSEKKHAGSYKCTTFSPLSHTIFIFSGHAVGTETTKLLRLGIPISIECKITLEDPEVQIHFTWYKDMEEIEADNSRFKIFQKNATLLILSPTLEEVGVYQCKMDDIQNAQSYNITLVYLSVKSMTKSMTVLKGDKLSIACEVEGDPMPVVMWFKDSENVEDVVNNTRFELETNDKGIQNATYVVEKAIYDDRANYTCYIASGDIQYNTTTFVRVKDMYAALWPFLGICAEVFILCLIIFVYEKRRAKNDFEESDTDQPLEQKNPSDHNKDSVRQRK